MRKVLIVWIGFCLMLAIGMANVNADEPSYYQNITHKLGRGIVNVVLCGAEWGRSIDYRINDLGPISGTVVGFVHGSGKTVERILVGAWDIVTFLIPVPPFNQYLMEPEFVIQKDME